MESNRKRRGFMKGKLMPFYRSPKATTTTTSVNQYSSKVVNKPSQSSTSTTAYVVHHHHHQDYIIAPPKQQQKVSFIVPSSATAENNRADKLLSQLDKLYGIAVDENVDIKAATYISSVQERFKLERSNSERVKLEDKK